jgi:hypothetical protein
VENGLIVVLRTEIIKAELSKAIQSSMKKFFNDVVKEKPQ